MAVSVRDIAKRMYLKIKEGVQFNAKPPAMHAMFSGSYSDVDCMEWQANSIAPKILIPKQMFERKLTELLNSAEYTTCTMEQKSDILNSIITELSELFQVSRQATMIRMHELGH